MYTKFLRGTSLLTGSNTTPGQKLTTKEKKLFNQILDVCSKEGLDYFPTIIQKVTYSEMSQIAAYGGFMSRYPHWKFGMEYEELQKGYEYGQFKIYEMVVNCCVAGTRVLTTKGTLSIEDVCKGDEVIVGSETRKVVGTKKNIPGSTKEIKIKGVGRPLICTKDHKWRVVSPDGLVWKETQQLINGDLLIAEDAFDFHQGIAPKLAFDKKSILENMKPGSRWQSKDINPNCTMNLKLAELLGVLTGDGSVGVKGNENDLYVTVGLNYFYYAEYVSRLFKDVFGSDAVIHKKSTAYVVMLQSILAVNFVDSLGLKKGCTFKNKVVPSIIFQSSQEYRAAYLKGLFDTDGYATNSLGMSGYNKELIYDVQQLLLEMGIYSTVVTRKNGKNKITVLTIQGNINIKKFSERINFSIDYKKEGLQHLATAKFCRSRGVKVPYVQRKLVEWADTQKINCTHSLKRSAKAMKKSPMGLNALNSFIEKAKEFNFKLDGDFIDIAQKPIYEVASVGEGPKMETFDISLDHKSHDFVANGFVTHNCDPCYIWLLSSNELVDNITVVAHATGHNDFFKNNIFFAPTHKNMMTKLSNHGNRIRKYMDRYGVEKVTQFIDHVHKIQTLVDPAKAWEEREIDELVIKDKKIHEEPRRLPVDSERLYMYPWLNPKLWRDKERWRIERNEIARDLGLFQDPTKDILGFIRDYAPLKPWQADIVGMIYEEAIYFAPQRMTKTLNEGWASYWDYEIMANKGYAGLGQKTHDAGIFHYAIHKMGVLGGEYSMNPYKTGLYLLFDIEERWNKGQFGTEWENCKNSVQRENWDLKLNLGREKLFEVRRNYDDVTLLHEFFTQEFCDKYEFFDWQKNPKGEYKIVSRDAKAIRNKLVQKHLNGGLPEIKLVDPNHRNMNTMLLQHEWDGRILYDPYVRETLASIYSLWNHDVVLATRNKNNEEIVYGCFGADADKDITVLTRDEYEKRY